MPTLEWIGKDKVVNHHLEVPYRVLDEVYTYGVETSENKIVRGDNLEALKALLPQYEGQIKCIYIVMRVCPEFCVNAKRQYKKAN